MLFMDKNIKAKKKIVGIVVSDKMEGTVSVKVTRSFAHSKYKKILRKSKKYLVSKSDLNPKVGDVVNMVSIRPLSKRVAHKLVN